MTFFIEFDEMISSKLAAFAFVFFLICAAIISSKYWCRGVFFRFLPILFCFAFVVPYSYFVLHASAVDALKNAGLSSIAGVCMVLALWVEMHPWKKKR